MLIGGKASGWLKSWNLWSEERARRNRKQIGGKEKKWCFCFARNRVSWRGHRKSRLQTPKVSSHLWGKLSNSTLCCWSEVAFTRIWGVNFAGVCLHVEMFFCSLISLGVTEGGEYRTVNKCAAMAGDNWWKESLKLASSQFGLNIFFHHCVFTCFCITMATFILRSTRLAELLEPFSCACDPKRFQKCSVCLIFPQEKIACVDCAQPSSRNNCKV